MTDHHPRRKNHAADASIGGALIWLGVTLLGVAVLARNVIDMTVG